MTAGAFGSDIGSWRMLLMAIGTLQVLPVRSSGLFKVVSYFGVTIDTEIRLGR